MPITLTHLEIDVLLMVKKLIKGAETVARCQLSGGLEEV